MSNLGKEITRFDGPVKVTGLARYASDQNVSGQLHGTFVTASIPKGVVTRVDVSSAIQVPGVVKILQAADMPRAHKNLNAVSVPPLATRFIPMQGTVVEYEGQPVVLVLAESLQAAETSAARVRVFYEQHPFVVPEQAPLSEPAHDRGNYVKSGSLSYQKGNATNSIAQARIKVAAEYSQPSRHGNPMEPPAILAAWGRDGLTVYDSVQHLPAVQNVLAAVFGLSTEQVRIISPHTGGGFGTKAFVWPHEILASMAAKVVGRPVKLVLTRQQLYSMVGYQPQINQAIALGADAQGHLQGITHDVDNITSTTDDYVEFACVPARAFYACENVSTRQSIRRGNVVLPTFMRSPWDGPGSWALGSAMDELALKLKVDPLELRLRNYAEVDPESGKPWSSKKLREAYEEGARRFGWRNRPKGGTRDGHWHLGYGMADCSQGQARFHSTARVRLKADGTAVVESSFCDIGTGPATIFPQIAASVLGLAPQNVCALSGDTRLPYSGPTYGSGTTVSTGAAVQRAAEQVRSKLLRLAGWPEEGVSIVDGVMHYAARSRTVQDVLGEAGVTELGSDASFDLPGGAPVDMGGPDYSARSFGAIFVEVAVDPELGLVRLRRATGVYSAGRIINSMTARSQMIGGIVWGWGMATMEASHFDPTVGRWLAKDLAGVAIPVQADIPPAIDVAFIDEFDGNAGPTGAKGIGELGATGVAAAVANAVYDAIGVRIRELPITPDKLLS
ncbi:xanthine dehydrogenase family protein molybdopterin-binding subunit [Pseudomonas fluorescens]